MKNLLKKLFNNSKEMEKLSEDEIKEILEKKFDFTLEQINSIREGLAKGSTMKIHKSPKFSKEQTKLIRKEILRTMPITKLRDIIKETWKPSVDYTDEQIEEIRSYLLQDMRKEKIMEKMAQNS